MIYPAWLKDFFTGMQFAYRKLWTDHLYDKETIEAAKKFWYMHLKDFYPEIIRKAIIETTNKYQYPPQPSQVVEIIKKLNNAKRDSEHFRQMDEKALLPKPSRKPLSREALEAKVKMFESLGMHAKAEAYANEIRHLDM